MNMGSRDPRFSQEILLMMRAKRPLGRSIFRKTAAIFVIVTLVPAAILGLRARHLYSSQTEQMVDGGLISRAEADAQTHAMSAQVVIYTGYGLVISLVFGYFFATSLVKPIRSLERGARRIGAGNFDHRVETETDDELEDLATAINQMAASLQMREKEVQSRNRELSVLYELAHTMSESRDINELLSQALDQTMRITGSIAGSVLIKDEQGQLRPVLCQGARDQSAHIKPPSDIFEHVAALALRRHSAALFDYPDKADNPRFDSITCIPLKFDNEHKGSICVTGFRDSFSPKILNLLSAIGSEVSVAIENARLFERLESQNSELALATTEIANLFAQAERQKSFGTRYENRNLVPCWELKKCKYTECPAYKEHSNLRCWQVAGTHCGGEVQGVFAQKLGRCEKCEVYKTACPDKITLMGETFNNMMAILEQRVDEQEGLQRQLFSSSKLAAIGELAAGVAHEINNPLTGILASAMLMKGEAGDPESVRKKATIIESEAMRARDIVRNLLDFARQSSNLERRLVSVGQLVDHSLFLIRHQADMAAVQINIGCDESLPDVAVDANQMKQVFMNIIQNALHAMKPGGTLNIHARAVTNSHGPEKVEVSFADTGVGMDAEATSRAFDPFFTTKRIGEGTGLGLSISHKMVHDHGGEIRVESSPGEGSTFTVILPAAGRLSSPSQDLNSAA